VARRLPQGVVIGTVILDGMTYRVGPKGQVVLPKAIRDRHGIQPGDLVEVEDLDGEIVVRKAMTPAEIADQLLGSLPPSDLDPLEELAKERRIDRQREDRRFEELE
jgi:AbrB family looped-hinge helix DNA binding protein